MQRQDNVEWLHKIPVLRPLIAWITGIIVAIGLLQDRDSYIVLNIAFILLLVYGTLHTIRTDRFKNLSGIVILLFFLFAGISWTLQQNESRQPGHFSNQGHENDSLIIRALKPAAERENSILIEGRVEYRWQDDYISETRGQILLYLEKDSNAKAIEYGDIIALPGGYQRLKPPSNPHAFDFSRYQFFRRTYHSMYTRSDEWIMLEKSGGHWLFSTVYSVRATLLEWQEAAISGGDELAVANALLTGYREDLEDHLRDAYAASGAMHILAVSGLHTGLVFLVFQTALAPLSRIRYGNMLQTILLISILWFYACLTGLQPSVCRAATMLSFVAAGMRLARLTNVYQSLAISAFILLSYDPYFLMQTGFQLSYAAVAGIVFLVPRFPELSNAGYLLNKVWTLICVSTAAQLFTAPLTLTYFGQFPPYFILTNLLALPVAAGVLYCGLAYFGLQALQLSFAASLSGNILDAGLRTLNYWIHFIHSLPGSPWQGIWIDAGEAAGFFAAMLLVLSALYLQQSKTLIAGLTILLLSAGSAAVNIFEKRSGQGLYVLENRSDPLILLHDRGSTTVLTGANKGNREQQYSFVLDPLLSRKGTDMKKAAWSGLSANKARINSANTIWSYPFGRIGDLQFMVLDKEAFVIEGDRFPEPDFIILANAPWVELQEISKQFRTDQFIIDSSSPRRLRARWADECESAGYKCHDVREKGAWILRYSD